MTASRDPDRLIRAFLEEGPTDLSDRSYDAVRSHIDRTRQRVVFGPWREPRMSNLARLAIAAAAVVAGVLVAVNVLPGGNQFGGPGPSPSPSPTATAAPTPTPTPAPTGPVALPLGSVPAGTYIAHPFLAPNDSVSFKLTLPAGWEAGAPSDSRRSRTRQAVVIGVVVVGVSLPQALVSDAVPMAATMAATNARVRMCAQG